MTSDQTALSDAQRRARRLFGFGGYVDSHASCAGQKAADCLAANAVFLDTETTGLDKQAEIIEIAIVDALGHPIIETRVKPTVPVGDGAYHVHGIGAHDLQNAPPWLEIDAEIRHVLEDRSVVIFNADFDTRLLTQTAMAARLPDFRYRSVTCAMGIAAQYFGPTNAYGSISLANSVGQAGVPQPRPAHSARGDATATAALVRAMAREHREKLAAG